MSPERGHKHRGKIIVISTSSNTSVDPFVVLGCVVHAASYNSSYIHRSRYAEIPFQPLSTIWDPAHTLCLRFIELHQLYSPTTAHDFLHQLLEESRALGTALDETVIYGKYVVDAWKGIIRSRGILP